MRLKLQYYEDGFFGYKGIDDKDDNIDHGQVLYEQKDNENKDEFFNRIDIRPKENMYGSIYTKDEQVNSYKYQTRLNIAREGYGLNKLVYDSSPYIRSLAYIKEHNCYLYVLSHTSIDFDDDYYDYGDVYEIAKKTLCRDYLKNYIDFADKFEHFDYDIEYGSTTSADGPEQDKPTTKYIIKFFTNEKLTFIERFKVADIVNKLGEGVSFMWLHKKRVK